MAMLDVVLEEKTAMEAFKGYVLGHSGLAPYFNFMRTLKTEGWKGVKDIAINRIKAQVMSFVPGSHHISVIKSWLDGNFQLEELLQRKKSELIYRGISEVFGNKPTRMVYHYMTVRDRRARRQKILVKAIQFLEKRFNSLKRYGVPHGIYGLENFSEIDNAMSLRGVQYRELIKRLKTEQLFLLKARQGIQQARKAERQEGILQRRLMNLNRLKQQAMVLEAQHPDIPKLNFIIEEQDVIDLQHYRNMRDILKMWIDLIKTFKRQHGIRKPREKKGVIGEPTNEVSPDIPEQLFVWVNLVSTAIKGGLYIPEYEVIGQTAFSSEPTYGKEVDNLYGRIIIIFKKTPYKSYTFYNESVKKWYHMIEDAQPRAGYGAWSLMGYSKGYNHPANPHPVAPRPTMTQLGVGKNRMRQMNQLKIHHHKTHRKITSIRNRRK